MLPTAQNTQNTGTVRRRASHLLSAVSVMALVSVASPAFAQDAPAADRRKVDEIIVTATKRNDDQTLQGVAASIAALGQDTLEKMGAVEFTDFSRSVVGLDTIDTGPGQKRYLIRGVNAPGESTVGLYIDNMPLTGGGEGAGTQGGGQPDFDLFDVRQIEVLRGPQGTLYGSSSVSGIIRTVTNKPMYNEYSGHLSGEYGDIAHGGDSWSLKGMLNIPVIEDKFAVRAVAYQTKTDGFVDSSVLRDEDGNLLKDINDQKRSGFRLSAKAELGPNTSILGQWLYQDIYSGARNAHNPYDSEENAGPPFIAILNPDGTYTRSNNFSAAAAGELKSHTASLEPYDENAQLFGLTLKHDFPGVADLTLAYSHQDRSVEQRLDSSPPHDLLTRFGNCVIAGCPSAGFTYFSPAYGASLAIQNGLLSPNGNVVVMGDLETKMNTVEARLASNWDKRFNYVAGVFWQDRDQSVHNKLRWTQDNGLPDFGGPILLDRMADNNTKQIALFGEGYFDVTDKLEIMGGLRWFETKRNQESLVNVPFLTSFVSPQCDDDGDGFITYGDGAPPIANPTHPVTGDPIVFGYGQTGCYPLLELNSPLKESDLIKKAQITYRPNDDISLFAGYAEGFRAGGTNAQILSGINPFFEHDETREYSLGAKTQWADGRVTANASLYRIDWYNQQTSVAITTQFNALTATENPDGGPISRSQGVEFELAANPVDNLDLGFNITFLKTKLLVDLIDVIPQSVLDASTEDFPVRGDKGQRLLGSPKHSGSAFAQYNWDVSNDASAFLRGDLQFQSEVPLNSYHPQRNLANNAYVFGNLRAGIETDTWGASVFVKNVTDEVADLFIANNLQSQNRVTVNQPRTIGVSFDLKFTQ